MRSVKFVLSALALMIFADGSAVAQESNVLDEVFVQATRRVTNLQTTPIAVSVVDARTIDTMAPRDIGDLSVLIPNFSAARVTSFANAASFAMRGVGMNNIIVYFEPPVSVLVDDFVITSVQTQLLDTFDIEQVEVLRGPQGTLFGKNTTGGAINVRTKRPVHNEMEAEARAGYGSYGSNWIKGMVNIPLVQDKLALRVVGSYEASDGYVRNGSAYGPITGFAPNKHQGVSGTGGGERTGGLDVFSGRAKMLWTPNDNFEALFQVEIIRDNTDFEATVNETPTGAGFIFDLIGLGATPGNNPLQVGGTTNRSDLLIGLPGLDVDIDGYYLNMAWDVGVGTITSVSGYRKQKSRLSGSETGNSGVIADDGEILSPFDINRADNRETLQQEFRFASDLEGPVNFVAGAFYQEEDIDFCVAQVLGFLDLLGAPTSGFSLFGADYGTFNQNTYILCNAQEAKSTALFTEGTWDLSDKLTFTGGFRYTWEKKTFFARQQVFLQELGGVSDPSVTAADFTDPMEASVYNYPFGVVQNDDKISEATWRFSMGYQLADNVYTYATYSRGFKSGGYNDQIGNAGAFGSDLAAFQVATSPTKPETADSYEIGTKIDTAGGRVRINLTAFLVEYKDLQRQINIPLIVNGVSQQITQFFNAAQATSKGIELEATALLTDQLTVRAIVGYQDCSNKEFIAPGAGYDLTLADCERAPEWQWTLGATYEANISDSIRMVFDTNLSYTAKNLYTQSITSQSFNTYLDSRTLLNASLTFSDHDDKYFVRLIGKNLTDTSYKVASQVVAGLWTFANYGPPLFIGVEIGVKWGADGGNSQVVQAY